jgi:hypothetical protein
MHIPRDLTILFNIDINTLSNHTNSNVVELITISDDYC